MAVPERISLFRAQASRAVGGNGRRTSHNPPDAAVLDIYDRLGVVVMDENRLFGNASAYVSNMGAMVKRDRNHASVVIWSFCNEFGCEGSHEAGGPAFRDVAYRLDGSRPTLANMFTFGDLLSNTIDVQARSRTPCYSLAAPYSLLLLLLPTHSPLPYTSRSTPHTSPLTSCSAWACRAKPNPHPNPHPNPNPNPNPNRASPTRAAPSSRRATRGCRTSRSSSRSAARATRCATRTRAARPSTTTRTMPARRQDVP